jgi:hypothetical protein
VSVPEKKLVEAKIVEKVTTLITPLRKEYHIFSFS